MITQRVHVLYCIISTSSGLANKIDSVLKLQSRSIVYEKICAMSRIDLSFSPLRAVCLNRGPRKPSVPLKFGRDSARDG
jgi:hypothetical protein